MKVKLLLFLGLFIQPSIAISQTLYLDTLKTHAVAPTASVGFTIGSAIYTYGGIYTLNSSLDISISGIRTHISEEYQSTPANGFAISLSGAITNELRGDILGTQLGVLYESVNNDITKSSVFGAGLLLSKKTFGVSGNKLVFQVGAVAVPFTNNATRGVTVSGKGFVIINGGLGLVLGKPQSTNLIIEPSLGYVSNAERLTGTVAIIIKL